MVLIVCSLKIMFQVQILIGLERHVAEVEAFLPLKIAEFCSWTYNENIGNLGTEV